MSRSSTSTVILSRTPLSNGKQVMTKMPVWERLPVPPGSVAPTTPKRTGRKRILRSVCGVGAANTSTLGSRGVRGRLVRPRDPLIRRLWLLQWARMNPSACTSASSGVGATNLSVVVPPGTSHRTFG